MRLGQLIDFRSSYDRNVEKKLLEFDCFFQDHMWDGFSEDKGQFITEDDFEDIQALSDKMKHMIFNIGCPNSIEGMLWSISERKIKYWGSYYSNHHGKQLRTKADRAMVIKDNQYKSYKNKTVIKGHFRWNHRAYTLSRRATDLLGYYLVNKW
jgi:hypothetical protein